ncbi:uncharacterized protein LOC129775866 isoform X8 [Toxorhynchites rutilus septentrionalis]|uniref:uncharacterized protein LOC129775866 isoform X8 n=1 Tax=Toxorhynchites rutilus septentrionalis TaxID=329112 RepID=UPI00247967AD|nr:uncharacterized protein LOC129775866 isoform X8 [Toxorhynchites rutilus septentrionalis]
MMATTVGLQNAVFYSAVAEEAKISFQIDTNSFSTDDFNLFINSLEKIYESQKLSSIVDHYDYSFESNGNLYETLNMNTVKSYSGYDGSSSSEGQSSKVSSFESLVCLDAPHNSLIQEQSVLSTRPSLLNIFSYFDEDISLDFEDILEEKSIVENDSTFQISTPIRPRASLTVKTPIRRQISVIKSPIIGEWNGCNNKLVAPTNKPPTAPGRLSGNLLKIFESQSPPPNNRKQAPKPPAKPPRNMPIIRNNMNQPDSGAQTKVDNDSIVRAAETPVKKEPPTEVSSSAKVSTVKIVNATLKVDSAKKLDLNLSTSSLKSVNQDRNKTCVRDINQLFLQYKNKLDPSLNQLEIQEVIQHIEKQDIADILQHMEEHVDVIKPLNNERSPETTPQKQCREHQTYRLKMRNLIDGQNFVNMSPNNRNQLFHLDKIFNRSNLSLIQMILSLIRANVYMGERVSVDIQGTDYNRFTRLMSERSYEIDSMTTSPICANCVAVEILAIDGDPTNAEPQLKIVIVFVIEKNDESHHKEQQQQRGAGESDIVAGLRCAESDFQFTVRLRFEPPENELQKSHETGTNLSEHQLRVQASLQRLNIPDWYKQYCGKDGPHTAVLQNNTNINISNSGVAPGAGGGVLRKRNSDVGRWTGLSSKTTSLSSLGSHRSDRSPVMLSPSAHSHHGGQTGFSRWSTSHLNSNQTSPSVSTRGSFTRGGLNASVVSGYSTASTTAGSMAGGNSAIRNSFRQPYLGWRSQEKLSQPRTPAERLASSLLSQQKAKEQQHHQNQQKAEPVVTPEIQSSIKEVTSAIVHYVNDQTNRHSRSRSTSPSQRCWLESSFVGTRPLDSPQTPMMIDNSSSSSTTVVLAGQQQHPAAHQTSNMMAGDHYRQNAGRMNGVVTPSVPTFSLPPEQQSPGTATLEDVLVSLLGLPTESHRSSVDLANSSCLTPTASSNHTLQIEPAQIRRRSEGDAGRRRNDSGGSGAISSSAASSGKENHSRRVSLDSCDTTHKSHGEPLKCRYPKCDATATIAEAKKSYKSCHNCSHLYCSRECRRAHWEKHRKACLHSRISALCRLVLSTCKDDADTLRHLSRLARRGYLSQGRGVVRILFRSPENADSFIKQGFQCLGEVSYVRWPDLLPSEMGPELYSELLKLSTEYKPDSKMLTYVAICVVSEAPGNATAPVKWERQLVSRCAKLKLCKSVINEISNSPIERQFPKKENATDVLILSFNILSKTTQKSREAVSQNIQNILRQRGVVLRKHYPEVFQRLCTFVEGSTDRYLPVTVHPRDSVTGRPFVCIIMPNYGDSDKVQFPISENCDDERVMTIDVGADVVDIRVEPAVDTDVNQ